MKLLKIVQALLKPKRWVTINDTNQKEVKINLGSEEERPSVVAANPNMKNKDIIDALKLVAANQEMLIRKWEEIHGIQELGD